MIFKKNNANKTLSFNVILNTLYEILIVITPLLTAPYVSRVLGSEGVGIYSYTYSLVNYFMMIAALGTVSYGCRVIAINRMNKSDYSKSFWEIQTLSVITSLLSLSVWLVISFVYKGYEIYMLILSFNILSSLFNISWLYAGLEKFKYTIAINAIVKILSVITIFIFINSKDDVWLYILINSLALFLGNLSMWFFLPKTVNKPNFRNFSLKAHFKKTLVFFIPTISSTIYTMIDKTLIGLITSDASQNGYYEQATKIINIAKSVCIFGINGVMTSRANYLFTKDDLSEAKSLFNLTLNMTSFLSIGACFGLFAISYRFVPIFFGDEFAPTIPILFALAPLLILICISNTLYQVYYCPSGKVKQASIYMIIGMIVNVILNVVLIYFFKAIGAAVASIVAEFVICLLMIIGSKGFFNFRELIGILWKKIIPGILMFGCVFCLEYFLNGLLNSIILLLINIIIGIIIYLLFIVIFKDQSLKELIGFLRGKSDNDGTQIQK